MGCNALSRPYTTSLPPVSPNWSINLTISLRKINVCTICKIQKYAFIFFLQQIHISHEFARNLVCYLASLKSGIRPDIRQYISGNRPDFQPDILYPANKISGPSLSEGTIYRRNSNDTVHTWLEHGARHADYNGIWKYISFSLYLSVSWLQF